MGVREKVNPLTVASLLLLQSPHLKSVRLVFDPPPKFEHLFDHQKVFIYVQPKPQIRTPLHIRTYCHPPRRTDLRWGDSSDFKLF